MKRLKLKEIILGAGLLVVLAILILPTIQVLAADNEYVVLAPLPGTGAPEGCAGGEPNCKTTLKDYLPGMFNLLIGLAAVLAVVRIVWGGFQYMSTDALQGKEEGKNMIWNSIKGLFLVIGAWLILYTINPKLLELNLNIAPVTIPTPAGGTPGGTSGFDPPMTRAEIDESNRIRNYLALPSNGVNVYTGPCTQGQRTLCVNLDGLTQAAENGVLTLRRELGLPLTITGGTEGGHSATGGHPTGNSIDFGFSRNPASFGTFVETNKVGPPVQTSLGPRYTVKIDGKDVTFLKESDHWHVTFN